MKNQVINYQDRWKEKKLDVDKIFLDPNNIRLEITNKSQTEIINDLFMNEDAMQILESIYENGYFADEPPVVVYEKDKYILLEGNRRVVSLKAMLTPNIAPSRHIHKIVRLMEGVTPIKKLEVRVADSREAAMQYLATKHTRNTRRKWTALRRAYFYYAQKEKGQSIEKLIERYKGGDNIQKHIRMYEMHHIAMSLNNISEETREKLANKRNFKISTLERFYNDKKVQDVMGISFNKVTGEVLAPKTVSFDKVYSRVITDIVDEIATSRENLDSEGNRNRYIQDVVNEVLEGKQFKKEQVSAADKFIAKIPSKRRRIKKLVPSNIRSTLDSPGIHRVLVELQYIHYKKFPNATHDLLRSFLEGILKKYHDRAGEPVKPKSPGGYVSFGRVLDATIAKMKNESNHEIKQILEDIKQRKWLLDGINHNPSLFSTEGKVKEQWDQMEELVRFIFKQSENGE